MDSGVCIGDQLEITLTILDRLQTRWLEFSLAEKCEVLRLMVKKIILGKDGKNKPEIHWNKPWDVLMSMTISNTEEIENRPIENTWFARQDSNLRPSDSKSDGLPKCRLLPMCHWCDRKC